MDQFLSLRRVVTWRVMQGAGAPWRRFGLALEALRIRMRAGKTRFVIEGSFGRTGNAIQQVLIAIAHAERFRGCLAVEEGFLAAGGVDALLQPFALDFAPAEQVKGLYRSIFFHFTEYTMRPGVSR